MKIFMKKLFTICALSAFLFTACDDDSASASSDEPVSSSAVKKSSSSTAKSSSSKNSSSSAKSSSEDDWDDDEEMCIPPTIFGLAGEEGCSDPSILSSVKPAKQCKRKKTISANTAR